MTKRQKNFIRLTGCIQLGETDVKMGDMPTSHLQIVIITKRSRPEITEYFKVST